MASISMKTVHTMKENGLMTNLMDKANANTEMADFMMDNGNKARKTEWEKYLILMELDLKAPLKMTIITALAFKFIPTA